MKIDRVTRFTMYGVRIVNREPFYANFRRGPQGVWEQMIGESWEIIAKPVNAECTLDELEKEFQEFINTHVIREY